MAVTNTGGAHPLMQLYNELDKKIGDDSQLGQLLAFYDFVVEQFKGSKVDDDFFRHLESFRHTISWSSQVNAFVVNTWGLSGDLMTGQVKFTGANGKKKTSFTKIIASAIETGDVDRERINYMRELRKAMRRGLNNKIKSLTKELADENSYRYNQGFIATRHLAKSNIGKVTDADRLLNIPNREPILLTSMEWDNLLSDLIAATEKDKLFSLEKGFEFNPNPEYRERWWEGIYYPWLAAPEMPLSFDQAWFGTRAPEVYIYSDEHGFRFNNREQWAYRWMDSHTPNFAYWQVKQLNPKFAQELDTINWEEVKAQVLEKNSGGILTKAREIVKQFELIDNSDSEFAWNALASYLEP